MKLFKTDPTRALAAVKAALASAEDDLKALQAERSVLLLETDEPGRIADIDRRIVGCTVGIRTHRDRADLLVAEIRKQAAERVEKRRSDVIDRIRKKLDIRNAKAVQLAAAVKTVGDLCFDLRNSAEEIAQEWPFPVAVDFRLALLRGLSDEVSWALHAAGRPEWNRETAVPAPTATPRVTGLEAQGIPAFVERTSAGLLDNLRRAKLPVEAA